MQVLAKIDNPHYLYRQTVLIAVAALAPVVAHDVLVNTMLPVVTGASQDKVPVFITVLFVLCLFLLPYFLSFPFLFSRLPFTLSVSPFFSLCTGYAGSPDGPRR